MNNTNEVVEVCKESSKCNETKPDDVFILPKVKIKICCNFDQKSLLPNKTLKNIQLLGDCVCEALKRQQNFSRALISKTTKEFYDIMQSRNLEIPRFWFQRVRYDYILIIANQEESQKETTSSEVDLHEILTFCMQQVVKGKKEIMPKFFTLDERIKIIRTFEKVPSCSKLSQLFGVSYDAIGSIMKNRDKIMESHNKDSISKEIEPLDIIIPTLMLKIRKEHEPSIPRYILKTIELLGECVCEALKRQQNFSRAWITKRTTEFYDIMQLNHFEIPDFWFRYVRCEYQLRFANKDEAQKHTLPVEYDLNEILTFCLNKMVENKNEAESRSHGYNNSFNNSKDQIKSFDHSSSIDSENLQITSCSEVLKFLKPIKDFATSCANNEGLKYISVLEQHIQNQ